MFELVNFDHWKEHEDAPHGSGASEKLWLVHENKMGLFKFPKQKSNGKITGEFWAEKLASEIGKLIGIDCAQVEIGTYRGRIGSMSFNFLQEDETLREGIEYISKSFPFYSGHKLMDMLTSERYSIQMILKCLEGFSFESEFFKVPVFDCLIGNSDRHHSNWATIVNIKQNTIKFAPLYDNGSSLCCLLDEDEIEKIYKDKMRFNALIDTKSRSLIGWNNETKVTHFKLIQYIKENHDDYVMEYLDSIKRNINENSIYETLNNFDDSIISKGFKKLLMKFLLERKTKMIG